MAAARSGVPSLFFHGVNHIVFFHNFRGVVCVEF